MFPLSQLGANADFTYTGLLILLWKKWMHYLSFARSIFLWCFTTSSVAEYAHTSSPITYSNMPELDNVLAWQKKCGLFLRSNIDLQSAFILSKLIQVSVRNLFVVALQWVIRLHLPLVKAFPVFEYTPWFLFRKQRILTVLPLEPLWFCPWFSILTSVFPSCHNLFGPWQWRYLFFQARWPLSFPLKPLRSYPRAAFQLWRLLRYWIY